MRQFLFAAFLVALVLWVAVGAIKQFALWSDGGSTCPWCGSTTEDAVPIVYGKPGKELMEQARQGQVVLGGCMESNNSPRWHCRRCGTNWGRYR